MIYKFEVAGDTLILQGNSGAVAGSLGYYQCEFSFSSEWEGLSKFAVFMRGDNAYTAEVTQNSCLIPAEVISSAGTVTVGVYGSTLREDNPVRISTDFAHIIIKEGAYREGTAPAVPSADLWEIYFERAAQEAKQVAVDSGIAAADAAKGEFAATLGNIELALDNIISIQESLIGGETT